LTPAESRGLTDRSDRRLLGLTRNLSMKSMGATQYRTVARIGP
jgi:hypothetical protein